MPDIDAIIQHGLIPSGGGPVDEANILIQSITITPAREKKAFKGPNKATQGLQYTDPTISFSIKAIISGSGGLATQHPGTAVTELANFSAAVHGFDPEQGTMVYEDPTDDLNNEDPDMVNFTVVSYPFVETA
jgi:hypothetical protein